MSVKTRNIGTAQLGLIMGAHNQIWVLAFGAFGGKRVDIVIKNRNIANLNGKLAKFGSIAAITHCKDCFLLDVQPLLTA